MQRRQKVEELAVLVEAARKRLKKKKAKRDAEKRAEDREELTPDQYRMRWGICPDGYNWSETEETCEERDPEPGEARDKMTKDERDEEDRERQERQEREARRHAEEVEKEFGLKPGRRADEDEEPDFELELEEPEPEPPPPPRIDEPEPEEPLDVDDLDELEVDLDDLEPDEEGLDDDELDLKKLHDLADEGVEAPKPEKPEPPLPKDEKLAEQVKRRRARRKKLRDLFHKNPKAYEKEVERMRQTGELPDRETAKMLAKIKDIDKLPDEILRDKDKVKEIIRQQDEQREHEELMLKRAEDALKALDAQRKRAERAGRKPPDFNPIKFLRDLELMYDRPLPERSEELDKKLNARGDDFLRGAISGGQDRGSPSYWWKELFEKLTRPLPKWRSSSAEGQMTTAATSPRVLHEGTEIGFPPYDGTRPTPKYIPNEPSGRPAFPPYSDVETVDYKERDAKMQGFPPYDGKGEPHDTETIGLPPYNRKEPHEGRGFPPFGTRRSVYDERNETVKQAVR